LAHDKKKKKVAEVLVEIRMTSGTTIRNDYGTPT